MKSNYTYKGSPKHSTFDQYFHGSCYMWVQEAVETGSTDFASLASPCK